jgi:hypothetical protein
MAEAFMSQGRCPAPQCLGGREHSISCANYRVEMKIQVQRAENFDSISWWPKDSRSPGFHGFFVSTRISRVCDRDRILMDECIGWEACALLRLSLDEARCTFRSVAKQRF